MKIQAYLTAAAINLKRLATALLSRLRSILINIDAGQGLHPGYEGRNMLRSPWNRSCHLTPSNRSS